LNTRTLVAIAAILLTFADARAAGRTATLDIDARDASRHMLHGHMSIPVVAGPIVLAYPKWIPGEHGPTGPIVNLAGLRFGAGGKTIPWQRDADDMYLFHLDVPAGADTLVVDFDFIASAETEGFTSGASTTGELAMISWNEVVLYPQSVKPDEWQVSPSVRLPAGWKVGTALAVAKDGGDKIAFQPVSLTTLVDSPVLAGAHTRVFPLADKPVVKLFVAADRDADLEAPPALVAAWIKLAAEARALFKVEHYRSYTFLLTLSDHVASFGLEHHESSDDRLPERSVTDDDFRRNGAGLLSHEYVHSWNGKYRRPIGLNPGSFEKPMRGELLWVYEGLTEYLGNLLAARSGLRPPDEYRDRLALTAAYLEQRKGRSWRPLADTGVAAQILYGSDREGSSWRRGVDFYDEGELIWLEADTIIRQKSGGKANLDDFCRKFHGGPGGQPAVAAYTLEDVIATLDGIAPYDWKGFFQTRVYSTAERAPLGGLEAAGWSLVWVEKPTKVIESIEEAKSQVDVSYSIGIYLDAKESLIRDVVPGSPAAVAGVAPGMKLVAVNGWKWSRSRLREAIRDTAKKKPIELMVDNGDQIRTVKLEYAGGDKYPRLERIQNKLDVLGAITAPLAQ
jgi:predicted metalloprotease with PDZ domain